MFVLLCCGRSVHFFCPCCCICFLFLAAGASNCDCCCCVVDVVGTDLLSSAERRREGKRLVVVVAVFLKMVCVCFALLWSVHCCCATCTNDFTSHPNSCRVYFPLELSLGFECPLSYLLLGWGQRRRHFLVSLNCCFSSQPNSRRVLPRTQTVLRAEW